MAKTMNMTRNQNHDDASSLKGIETCDNAGVEPWSDLNHDLLLLVMMQLGVIDFLAFSGVCKSWRSFALDNRSKFMVSKPPMSISISPENACYLEDFEGRKFRTILPHSGGRTCIGLTCGYLILFSKKIHDFWLVNPITRHELHFPHADVYRNYGCLRGILVFSPSVCEWVFVISNMYSYKIQFSIAGTETWTHISTPVYIHDLHAFKGKIYTLHPNYHSTEVNCLGEIKLYPEPNFMLLETKDYPIRSFMLPQFVNTSGKLYSMDCFTKYPFEIHELDFGEMRWVSCEKTNEEYTLFLSNYNSHDSAVMQESCVDHWSQNVRYALNDQRRLGWFSYIRMWYFFHDCLNVNLLQE